MPPRCLECPKCLQLGRRAFRALLLASLLPAAVPLGIKATQRLRNLLFRNPRTVDDVRVALDAVVQRVGIMHALLATNTPAGAQEEGPADAEGDMVHVSAADCSSPNRGAAERIAVVAGGGGGAVAEARPEGRAGVAQVAAAPPAEGVVALSGADAGERASVAFSEPQSR